MNVLQLFKTEIIDPYIRDNFLRIADYLRDDAMRKGQFKFFERYLDAPDPATAIYPYTLVFSHNLNFQPKDVISLSIIPEAATLSWKYSKFTRSTVTVVLSAACTFRGYIGRYEES